MRDALRHTAFGALLMAVAWGVTLLAGWPGSFGAAWAAAAGFYLGRERRDHEIRARIPIRDWWRGWNVGKWDIKEREDLLGPIVALALIAWLAQGLFGSA